MVLYVTKASVPAVYKNAISFFIGSFFLTSEDLDPFERSYVELKTHLGDPVALVSKCKEIMSQVSQLFKTDPR
jgi:hypothetical protein